MPKARQQYFADEISLNKEARTFSLDDELLQKIEDMDIGEENVIEVVKVNSVPLPVDAQKAVDVTVPLVVDNLTSTSTTNSLSANQWKILYDYIVNLQSRGRFLSSWNASTGTPVTAPFWSGYNYNPGDYYVVTIVNSGWTNYRPDWTTYISWQASTVVETENVEISDMYIFDGTQWLFQKNTARQIAVDSSLSTTSTNPVENRVITNELNNKQNKLIAWDNIQIDSNTNTISATGYSNLPAAQGWTDNTLVTTWDKYNWDNKQDSLQAWANIQINWNVISSTNTTYGNLPEAQGGTSDTLVTTWDKYNWNHKQDSLTAWQNITISNGVISSTNTTYSAGAWITIDSNNVISAHDVNATWGNITWDINNQTDLQNVLNNKQDKLIAWNNITINNNTISATDTIYNAWSWITINAYNEIINDKQFNPSNLWVEGQVLKRNSLWWYSWENESWGGWWASVDNTPFNSTWDWVTWVAPSKNAVYDKISAMDITIAWKQDQLTAWQNIQINWNVISSTDTKYTAADFDIKDLADSSNLRNTWNNKQDKINDLQTIREWAAKWATALQPWDKVSKLVNDAWYITKAVSDLTNYYTKNQTYTKAEIDALIANFAWFKVVAQLPTTDIKTTLIYLLWPSANNTYEEYVYIDNQWVKIGETSMDLTNYFHKTNDDSDDIIEGSTHLFMTPAERTNLSHQSGTNTWDETQASIQNKLGVATSTKSGYLSSGDWNTFNNKQDKLVAWANIQINGNVISATTGSTYSAWDYISIDSNNTISNTKPFVPANTWSVWQILTKTPNWYRRETGSGGWGWVTSVNWRTGDVTVQEFDPDNSWDAGQVLKKTSGGYVWANESWGWGDYYGWNWINVTSTHEIINTKPFDPAQWGSVWQVLTKTSGGYEWASVSWGAANVKCFELNPSDYTQEEIWEIIGWVNRGASYWAIIKMPSTGDVCIYSRVMSSNGGLVYEFPWILYFTDWNNDGNGDYTTLYNHELKITRANNTYTVEFENFNGIANFLKVSNSWYQVPYMPAEDYQPATKAYVDAVAAGSVQVPAITNNTTWTTLTLQQEWVGTQAQYNQITPINWVIYNIIPSS